MTTQHIAQEQMEKLIRKCSQEVYTRGGVHDAITVPLEALPAVFDAAIQWDREQRAKELPELPEPDVYEYDIETAMNVLKAHSPDQLQAYGAACAAHAREVALSEVLRRVRGATGGAIQPNDWWVGFKTARTQFTNAIEQLKAGK